MDTPQKHFDKLSDETIIVDGKVRVILEETDAHILTSGESHTIDLWLKPQKEGGE